MRGRTPYFQPTHTPKNTEKEVQIMVIGGNPETIEFITEFGWIGVESRHIFRTKYEPIS